MAEIWQPTDEELRRMRRMQQADPTWGGMRGTLGAEVPKGMEFAKDVPTHVRKYFTPPEVGVPKGMERTAEVGPYGIFEAARATRIPRGLGEERKDYAEALEKMGTPPPSPYSRDRISTTPEKLIGGPEVPPSRREGFKTPRHPFWPEYDRSSEAGQARSTVLAKTGRFDWGPVIRDIQLLTEDARRRFNEFVGGRELPFATPKGAEAASPEELMGRIPPGGAREGGAREEGPPSFWADEGFYAEDAATPEELMGESPPGSEAAPYAPAGAEGDFDKLGRAMKNWVGDVLGSFTEAPRRPLMYGPQRKYQRGMEGYEIRRAQAQPGGFAVGGEVAPPEEKKAPPVVTGPEMKGVGGKEKWAGAGPAQDYPGETVQPTKPTKAKEKSTAGGTVGRGETVLTENYQDSGRKMIRDRFGNVRIETRPEDLFTVISGSQVKVQNMITGMVYDNPQAAMGGYAPKMSQGQQERMKSETDIITQQIASNAAKWVAKNRAFAPGSQKYPFEFLELAIDMDGKKTWGAGDTRTGEVITDLSTASLDVLMAASQRFVDTGNAQGLAEVVMGLDAAGRGPAAKAMMKIIYGTHPELVKEIAEIADEEDRKKKK